jgi:hypothetical protein
MPLAQDMLLKVRYPCATTVLAATCGLGGRLVASSQVPTNREQRPCRRAEDEASKAMARNNEPGGHAPGRSNELCRGPRAAGVCRLTTCCGDSPLSSLSPLSSASPPSSLLWPISLCLQMVRVGMARWTQSGILPSISVPADDLALPGTSDAVGLTPPKG